MLIRIALHCRLSSTRRSAIDHVTYFFCAGESKRQYGRSAEKRQRILKCTALLIRRAGRRSRVAFSLGFAVMEGYLTTSRRDHVGVRVIVSEGFVWVQIAI